jgi:hypothetical protein
MTSSCSFCVTRQKNSPSGGWYRELVMNRLSRLSYTEDLEGRPTRSTTEPCVLETRLSGRIETNNSSDRNIRRKIIFSTTPSSHLTHQRAAAVICWALRPICTIQVTRFQRTKLKDKSADSTAFDSKRNEQSTVHSFDSVLERWRQF